jgi:hypothetical protein
LSDHKKVKDIVTTGVSEAEYWRLYRERTTADRVEAASEMGVLDQKWAKEIYEALRNPAVRRGHCLAWLGVFMGFGATLISYAIARVVG